MPESGQVDADLGELISLAPCCCRKGRTWGVLTGDMGHELLVVGNDFAIVNVGKSGQYETVDLRLE